MLDVIGWIIEILWNYLIALQMEILLILMLIFRYKHELIIALLDKKDTLKLMPAVNNEIKTFDKCQYGIQYGSNFKNECFNSVIDGKTYVITKMENFLIFLYTFIYYFNEIFHLLLKKKLPR